MRDRAFIHKPDPIQTSLRNLKLDQRDHGRALGKLRSSLQTPTHPIYDEDGPLDPVETQIAWRGDKESPEYYRNGAWHPFSGAPDWLILFGISIAIPGTPSGDSDHAKFDPDLVLTNDLDLWTFDLDGSDRIKQVNVSKPGLYELACSGAWGAPTGSYRKSTTINSSVNHAEDFNGIGPFFGMSNTDTSIDADETDHSCAALCPITAQVGFMDHGGYFTVEPDHNNGADVVFKAPYLWIKRFELA